MSQIIYQVVMQGAHPILPDDFLPSTWSKNYQVALEREVPSKGINNWHFDQITITPEVSVRPLCLGEFIKGLALNGFRVEQTLLLLNTLRKKETEPKFSIDILNEFAFKYGFEFTGEERIEIQRIRMELRAPAKKPQPPESEAKGSAAPEPSRKAIPAPVRKAVTPRPSSNARPSLLPPNVKTPEPIKEIPEDAVPFSELIKRARACEQEVGRRENLAMYCGRQGRPTATRNDEIVVYCNEHMPKGLKGGPGG